MDIYWLDGKECRDPARVGGKAAQLGRLAQTYPVPPGFCLAVAGHDSATRPTDLQKTQLATAYAQLGSRCGKWPLPVAVRSSAVDEDGHDASFAGQHESYLNVIGLEPIAAAIVRCLASAGAERARAYRRARGLEPAGGVAVLVQQLIVADVSAVVFSLDPRIRDRSQVIINATWGLGESLVGGTVVPDLYAVRKRDLAIVEQQVADKACMTVAAAPPGQATREVPVPGPMRREAALAPHQALELARLACDLEAACGWPVDLECAYRCGRPYLLQCRPVTFRSGALHL
ncbi:MAG: PEP/pyruvate-binding domain-containing protein [Anaerolineae bacterium]|nr:PEP/pyruvate-binding domain-containing protein [Anaerolineae bacterium]